MSNEYRRNDWTEWVIPTGFVGAGVGVAILATAIEKVGKKLGELSMTDLVDGLNMIGDTARATRVQAFCAEAGSDLVPYLLCGQDKLMKFGKMVEDTYVAAEDVLETFAGGAMEVMGSIGTADFGSVVSEHQAISIGLVLVAIFFGGSVLYGLHNLYAKSPKIEGMIHT